MNYYIDFDSTLYNTTQLREAIFGEMANYISKNTGLEYQKLKQEVINDYKANINMFEYAGKLADKYGAEKEILVKNINDIISTGKRFVYDDSVDFLKKIKEKDNKIVLFTYTVIENQDYQLKKILGSGLSNYFDRIITTSEDKSCLDIDYENSIFIDDNPDVLKGLITKKPLRIIRIKRNGNKYSKTMLNDKNIEECISLKDIENI